MSEAEEGKLIINKQEVIPGNKVRLDKMIGVIEVIKLIKKKQQEQRGK